ncbi:hypothetical protein MTO96_005340 [Rhipicephalus appendiculatus]
MDKQADNSVVVLAAVAGMAAHRRKAVGGFGGGQGGGVGKVKWSFSRNDPWAQPQTWSGSWTTDGVAQQYTSAGVGQMMFGGVADWMTADKYSAKYGGGWRRRRMATAAWSW